ncbi:MAG: hypothetical protein H6742_20650 [Alphaproteobacteria bacterium]|nr:hypothetical protein [Alphaproteobacteria bacterium]
MNVPEQKNSGTLVAVSLVVLGFTAICCGCGGFMTAAIVQADQESEFEPVEMKIDTGWAGDAD